MFMVVLAQLVEHRIVVPSVVGSSATFHPKTAEIPFGIAAVFFVRMYGREPILSGSPTKLVSVGRASICGYFTHYAVVQS